MLLYHAIAALRVFKRSLSATGGGKGPEIRSKICIAGERFPPTNTAVVAIAIRALNQPQTFINPRHFKQSTSPADKTTHDVHNLTTTSLLDIMLRAESTRAVGSDALRAIICHQWRHFGYAYSMQVKSSRILGRRTAAIAPFLIP